MEELIGRAIKGRRDEVILATKFGVERDARDPNARHLDSRPETVRVSCDASLKRLGVERIDLYYQHRLDPNVPIEETVGAMADLVQAGKVGFLGLCEIGGETLARAHNVPIRSLWCSRNILYGIARQRAKFCRHCVNSASALSFLAHSAKVFLRGKFVPNPISVSTDWRHNSPRFQEENVRKNLELVAEIEAIADEHDATPAVVPLAWLLAQGNDVVPIQGPNQRHDYEENLGALSVRLSEGDLARVEAVFTPHAVAGERYGKVGAPPTHR